MKSLYIGYFKPSEANFKEMWQSSLIVFDTNVLLHLYRYSEETREQLLKIIDTFKDRIWIPRKVADEFFDKRLEVLRQQIQEYDTLTKTLDKVEADLGTIRQHPFVAQRTLEQIKKLFVKVKGELVENKGRLLSRSNDDEILQRIGDLFEGKVGESFSQTELEDIYTEGARRVQENIPPGFKDARAKANSGDNYRIYGDLILWKQILVKAASSQCGVIFVSDDKKEDWWLEFQGRIISPLPYLFQEFHEATHKLFYMYTVEKFIEHTSKFLETRIEPSIIEEVRDIRESTKVESKTLDNKLKVARTLVKNYLEQRKGNRASFIAIRNEVDEEYTDDFLNNLIAKYSVRFRTVQVRRNGQYTAGITLVKNKLEDT